MLLIYIELSTQILQAKVLTQLKFAQTLVHLQHPPPKDKQSSSYKNQSSKPVKNAG